MWIPNTEQEIRAPIEAGVLHEHELLEFKREPSGKGLREDASDIAAMSGHGGVLVYGVAEDPWTLAPLDGLTRARERLDQAVQHLVTGDLAVEMRPIPCGEIADDRGYLVVVVPASPGAPHGVRVGTEVRFYGRGATGRRPLAQGEIDALYERRQRWAVDRDAMLAKAIASLPGPLATREGKLVVVVRPVGAEDGLLDRTIGTESQPPAASLQTVLHESASAWPTSRIRPDFGELGQWDAVPRGYRSSTRSLDGQLYPRTFLSLRVFEDGTVELVTLCAVVTNDSQDRLIAEEMIANHVARTLAFAGTLFDRAHYGGPVDVALMVDGLKGAISYRKYGPRQLPPPGSPPGYEESEYRRTVRATNPNITDARELAAQLLQPLSRVTVGEQFDLLGALCASPGV